MGPDTIDLALKGAAAFVTTAVGYSARKPGDTLEMTNSKKDTILCPNEVLSRISRIGGEAPEAGPGRREYGCR